MPDNSFKITIPSKNSIQASNSFNSDIANVDKDGAPIFNQRPSVGSSAASSRPLPPTVVTINDDNTPSMVPKAVSITPSTTISNTQPTTSNAAPDLSHLLDDDLYQVREKEIFHIFDICIMCFIIHAMLCCSEISS